MIEISGAPKRKKNVSDAAECKQSGKAFQGCGERWHSLEFRGSEEHRESKGKERDGYLGCRILSLARSVVIEAFRIF